MHESNLNGLNPLLTVVAILLAGCTVENLNSICLITLSYSQNPTLSVPNATAKSHSTLQPSLFTAIDHAGLEVRVGYFSMCLKNQDQWVCSRDIQTLESFFRRTQPGEAHDPLQILRVGEKFKYEVIFTGLIFISIVFSFIAFILLETFPAWAETEDPEASDNEPKPFPSRPVSMIVLVCLFFSSLCSLLAGFWQHLSSSAAIAMGSVFSQGAVEGHVCAGAMALGWISFFLLTLSFLMMLIMILSIRVLSEMVN
ncbi:uncharacterized protein CTRU02_215100 [Colletotrichum truncatum]|uniref:Uncharacterized protein n=1 Tax=Colletotrichum truncatum TaxID=5467 RepID=A0ACC3YDG8_COLTU|nr:uncharacterized protein CTRU02_13715 [Colletotrichum truncatum]KAF6783063.1 hypothetical protein CTRU02_13715 [Colletotrichum truncatum]